MLILFVCEKPNWVQNLTVQFAKSSHYFPLHMCTRQQHSHIFWWSHLQEKNHDLRTTYAMILSQLMLRLCSMPSDLLTMRATEIVWDRSFKVCLHVLSLDKRDTMGPLTILSTIHTVIIGTTLNFNSSNNGQGIKTLCVNRTSISNTQNYELLIH